ncbi:MAG: hypothetical protein O6933_05925, partial [Planctomycetota bacterium]|nr:hypothetical protein [Planctomycetota bacterium]
SVSLTGTGINSFSLLDETVTPLPPPPSTADISGPLGAGFPDGCVDAFDLGTLLGAWCSSAGDPDPPGDVDPPCEGCTSPNFALADISGAADVADGCVDAFDLGKLLANWCSVAGGNPCGTCFPLAKGCRTPRSAVPSFDVTNVQPRRLRNPGCHVLGLRGPLRDLAD